MDRESKHRPLGSNRLFFIILVFSVGFHMILLIYLSGNLDQGTLSAIELSLHNLIQSDSRNIPRPPVRQRPSMIPVKIKERQTPRLQRESLIPEKIDPMDKIAISPMHNSIDISDLSEVSDISIANYMPSLSVKSVQPLTAAEYLEMVRLKIEKYKKYPVAARARQVEGRATVQFFIEPSGEINSIKILKSSKHKLLDRAAVEAVNSASPVPKLPSYISNEAIQIEIKIVFEIS